jgi:hypothetical protein
MLSRLLLLLRIAVVDLDLVSRALATDLIRTHDIDVLDAYGTQKELRRKYAVVATQTGLPIHAQRKVAEMAWEHVAAAQDRQEEAKGNRKEFSFYS